MSLKDIFREGMKERRRRKSLAAKGKEFREKTKLVEEKLAALGQKAWEAQAGLAPFADLRSELAAVQKTLDELKANEELLLQQKQETEDNMRRENERLDASLKTAEEKKNSLEKRWQEQQNALQAGQKQAQGARERLAALSREKGQLQGKAAGAEAGEAQKAEIAKGIALLDQEASALQTKIASCEEAGRPVAALAASLQEEVAQAKKQVADLRQERKQITADLDKKISALKGDLAKAAEKAREAGAKRRQAFSALGEKLADAKSDDPALAAEMAAAGAARSEREGVQAMIGGLERQMEGAQVSAYKKMMALIIGGGVLLAVLVTALLLLLAPKKKENPIEAVISGRAEVLQQMAQMAGAAQKATAGQAEEQPVAADPDAGKKIVDEILAVFDRCVAEAADLAKDRPEAPELLAQLDKLYAGYDGQMAALNARLLALRDEDVFAFRAANGHMSENRPKHVFAKDNALSQAIAYYNFEKGEQAVVDMLSSRIVKLLDRAMQQ